MTKKPTGKHAIVIGGSLGGLFTGIMLRSIGWDVDIYERSAQALNNRGLVNETELARDAAALFTERFVFYQFPNSHILQYVIPGEHESLLPGERRFNWVWYVNYDQATELPRILTDRENKRRDYSIPPGTLAPAVEQEMRAYADGKQLMASGQQLGNRSQFSYGSGREGEDLDILQQKA